MDGAEHPQPDSVDLNMLRSRIGMVFQKPTPFPMTIYDNIAFGVKLHETAEPGRHGRAGRMVAHPLRPVARGEGPA